jgi:outer membrane protease
VWASGWSFEGGGRYWYSWGKFQKDLPLAQFNDKSLVSRLTWKDTANAGEFFGRIDTPVNVFLKGYVGGGSISSGHINDEDWLPPSGGAYSNTLSSASGSLPLYYTVDLGYDFLRGSWYKVGGFVGANHYSYKLSANGCTQIADQSSGICTTAFPVAASALVLTESDTWNSLRVGVSAETQLFDRWKLSGEVAYVPYTKFTGTDTHPLRDLVIPESGHGQGVQAEAFLNYYVTDAFSVGVGGRYWALWTSAGTDTFIFSGVSQGVTPRNDTFRAERVGVTFQGAYKF